MGFFLAGAGLAFWFWAAGFFLAERALRLMRSAACTSSAYSTSIAGFLVRGMIGYVMW